MNQPDDRLSDMIDSELDDEAVLTEPTGKDPIEQYAPKNRYERRRAAAIERKEKARLRIQRHEQRKNNQRKQR